MERDQARTYALDPLPGKSRLGSRKDENSDPSQQSQQLEEGERSGSWMSGGIRRAGSASYDSRVRSSPDSPTQQHRATRTTSDDSQRMIIHRTTDTTVEYDR